ncbi:D-galactarate dehydratase [Bacillus salipaludis]|uniref:D-galactarate dehydratase n=1 Tax=Bacillus salipaludis TaxID=2547811 RepID=A0A4R5VJZ6_9BACI|nr:UxaA family hydrolase [Bacillus salipaludis]TDK58230.1 D-galactarate dehydratase [Bacillus salipaludis]
MNKAYKTVMMQPNDKVAIALMNIPAGSHVQVTCKDQKYSIEIKENIEFGHKFAVKPISRGEDILKYGEVIGLATTDIEPGEHVHIHNLEGKRGRGDKVEVK